MDGTSPYQSTANREPRKYCSRGSVGLILNKDTISPPWYWSGVYCDCLCVIAIEYRDLFYLSRYRLCSVQHFPSISSREYIMKCINPDMRTHRILNQTYTRSYSTVGMFSSPMPPMWSTYAFFQNDISTKVCMTRWKFTMIMAMTAVRKTLW